MGRSRLERDAQGDARRRLRFRVLVRRHVGDHLRRRGKPDHHGEERHGRAASGDVQGQDGVHVDWCRKRVRAAVVHSRELD